MSMNPTRPLPLPGLYSCSGPCVRCGGALPEVVRSGLAAYFCDECWGRIEARASGLGSAFHGQRDFGRVEDD
jgi:hypothetical protein